MTKTKDDHNEDDHNEEDKKPVQIEATKSKDGGTNPPEQAVNTPTAYPKIPQNKPVRSSPPSALQRIHLPGNMPPFLFLDVIKAEANRQYPFVDRRLALGHFHLQSTLRTIVQYVSSTLYDIVHQLCDASRREKVFTCHYDSGQIWASVKDTDVPTLQKLSCQKERHRCQLLKSKETVKPLAVSLPKKQSSFDQVSEFERGRIVVCRNSGLSLREIGSRVGRNQTTVMRICDRWKQDGTTDRRVRSHPPQCTTSRADRQIVRMVVTDRLVTSRTVAQHIQSVTHHLVSARTIRRRLQQSGLSARRPLLRLPLTQNHRRLRRQWCDERRMWTAEWNEIVFTDESRFCLQHHDGRIRIWRRRGERMLNSCVMHRHTGPVPGIMVWDGIGNRSRTPLVRIAGTLNSQRYISEKSKEAYWSKSRAAREESPSSTKGATDLETVSERSGPRSLNVRKFHTLPQAGQGIEP
ncbi:hypothetical protein LAZ67_6003389 [Cordylochernes scorpioides]|uniref:Transposase Tc1-like domain-containing protein n=1 Tax=Cordylochernes scorpioides TaxID=51811 RepID=A0ABY6KL73_9ARAC|nr:hypothetical protein LAZ67_6003389 [Cordylochernes scorpioides]